MESRHEKDVKSYQKGKPAFKRIQYLDDLKR